MVHVLLMILKGIGALIGGILILLLLILALILFVPLRYQAEIRKNGAPLSGSIRTGWLFRMLQLNILIEQRGRPSAQFLLFGHAVRSFPPGSRKKASDEHRMNRSSTKIASRKSTDEPKQVSPAVTRQGRTDTSKQCLDTRKPASDTSKPCSDAQNRSSDTSRPCSDAQNRSSDTSRPYSDTQNRSSDTSIWYERTAVLFGVLGEGAGTAAYYAAVYLFTFLHVLFDVPRLMNEGVSYLLSGSETETERLSKWKHSFAKTGRLLDKPEEFLQFSREYRLKETAVLVKKELLILLRHFRPRTVTGSISYGTWDPAFTGMLTGLIYLILPAKADTFQVRPDFYEMHLETDAAVSGRIRICHLIPAAWHILKERDVRRLIARIRKKEK